LIITKNLHTAKGQAQATFISFIHLLLFIVNQGSVEKLKNQIKSSNPARGINKNPYEIGIFAWPLAFSRDDENLSHFMARFSISSEL